MSLRDAFVGVAYLPQRQHRPTISDDFLYFHHPLSLAGLSRIRTVRSSTRFLISSREVEWLQIDAFAGEEITAVPGLQRRDVVFQARWPAASPREYAREAFPDGDPKASRKQESPAGRWDDDNCRQPFRTGA